MSPTPAMCLVLVSLCVVAAALSTGLAHADTVPEGVDMLLPRGGIPAIFDPQFVPVDKAQISDDAWVLGVVVGGEARAYSLNLLNSHEIVNDRVGNIPFAAVW